MTRRKQIILGSVISYAAIIINVVAGLLYTPWMIKQIGQSDYGLYTLAYSLINLFLLDFGLSSAASRFISIYRAEGDQEKINRFLGMLYKLFIAIDAIIFLILLGLFFFINNVYANLTSAEIERFKVIYVIASFYSVLSFPFLTLNGVLTAYEKIIQLKIADIIHRVLVVSLTVMALLRGWGLYSLVAVNAISGLVVILFKLIVIRRFTPVRTDFKSSDRDLLKEIMKYSLWITVALLAQRLVFNITPSILGIVSGSKAISLFGIVTTIEAYVFTFATAINGIFISKIARIYSNSDGETDISELMVKVGKFQFGINALIIIGFACIGLEFINVWVGPDYLDSYVGILLVIVPGLFYNSLEVAHTAIMVKNKVKVIAFINLAMGILNIALSFPLSFLFGMMGACIAICVAYSLRVVLLFLIYPKLLNINIIGFTKNCYLKFVIPIISTLFVGIAINYLIPNSGWLWLAIKGSVIVFVFLVMSSWLVLNKDEKEQIFGRFIKVRGENNEVAQTTNKGLSKQFYILRFFGIISVLFAHCGSYQNEYVQTISNLLGLIGVPCFMICSGYFFNNEESASSFWRKKLLHVILPWIVIGSLTYLLRVILGSSFDFKEAILWIVGYGTWLYYIPNFLIVCLLFRITKYIKSSIVSYSLIAISIIANVLIICRIISFNSLTTYLNPFSFVLFFGLGLLAKKYGLIERAYNSKITLLISSLIFVLIFALVILFKPTITYWEPFSIVFELCSFVILLWLSRLFMFRPLEYFGKKSLFFYLFHMQVGIGVTNRILSNSLELEPFLLIARPLFAFLITAVLIILIAVIIGFCRRPMRAKIEL